MGRISLTLTLVGGFLVGCVTAAAVDELGVRPVSAQAAATRWEYACKNVGRHGEDEETAAMMNEFGARGWEVVTLASNSGDRVPWYIYCFKRPR